MAKRDNPVLGTIECDGCGGVASVHQTARGNGRFLYTRCGECGCDQRAGAAVQKRLWMNTEWRPDASPIKPPNVPDEIEQKEPEKEPEITEPVQVKKAASNQVKSGPLVVLGAIVLGALAFAS